MRTGVSSVLLGVLLVVPWPLPSKQNDHPAVCSLAAFSRLKSDSTPYFIGTAEFDTLPAGPGSTKSTMAPGHFGRPRERPIYGQVVRVEKWGGNATALQRVNGNTAVVVPWDYGPDCSTTPWGGRWVWLRTGDRMFLFPVLRELRYWIDGHPTFDAFTPQFDAFPVRYEDPVMPAPPQTLTVDQLFELFERLPSIEEISKSGWAATENAANWAKANPDIASRYPAPQLGWSVSWEAGSVHARKIKSPLTGTYRFMLVFPSGRERDFYVRTSDQPVGAWHIIHASARRRQREWRELPDGYELKLWMARSERELPKEPDGNKDYDFNLGIREVGDSDRDSTVWHAEFEVSGLYSFEVLDDDELNALMTLHREWFSQHFTDGSLPDHPGTFVRHADGRIAFEQPIELGNAKRIIIRAVRVSPVTIRDTVCYARAC